MTTVDDKGITRLREIFINREKELEELRRYLVEANDSVGKLVMRVRLSNQVPH